MLTLCYDRLMRPGIGYPNLARHQAQPFTPEWRQFDQHWPRTVPLRLLMYTNDYRVYEVGDDVADAWYPIGIGWFDFELDYFAEMSEAARSRVRERRLRVLFYYHEGDNPARIKQRLDQLAEFHGLDADCYRFVSANTQADDIKNFIYFPDHEFFFRYVNREQPMPTLLRRAPGMDFTVLNRTHKWWRASLVSDLEAQGLLNNSLWSYNTAAQAAIDDENDNPIELDSVPGWRKRVHEFVARAPKTCDQFNADQHNDHHVVNQDLYRLTRCQLVFETHFDVDQSGGAFLTEKTFKAIKFGQPFIVVGGPGSLRALREAGYRTFDSVIDPSYDDIQDNTQRWHAIANTLYNLVNSSNQWWYICQSDVAHNQKMFESRSAGPVNTLIEEITCR